MQALSRHEPIARNTDSPKLFIDGADDYVVPAVDFYEQILRLERPFAN